MQELASITTRADFVATSAVLGKIQEQAPVFLGSLLCLMQLFPWRSVHCFYCLQDIDTALATCDVQRFHVLHLFLVLAGPQCCCGNT